MTHLVDVKRVVFTKEAGILIKVLRQSKGFSARKLLEEFPDKDWSCSALDRLLRQTDDARIGVKFGTAEGTAMPNFTPIGASYRPCGAKKPQHRLLINCNTGGCLTGN